MQLHDSTFFFRFACRLRHNPNLVYTILIEKESFTGLAEFPQFAGEVENISIVSIKCTPCACTFQATRFVVALSVSHLDAQDCWYA